MTRADALTRRVRKVAGKVARGKATTAEDVHITAIAWAIAEQRNEAAAGLTTGADLALLRIVRAHDGAGDAAAQAICDAATTWRHSTQVDGDAGTLRQLLADAVDHHHGLAERRRRLLWAAAGAVGVAGVGAAGDILMAVEQVPPGPVRAIPPAVGLAGLLTAIVMMWLLSRIERR